MKYLSILFQLLIAGLAAAQDMPLSEIIKPGETWQPASGDMPAREKGRYHFDLKDRPLWVTNGYVGSKDGIYKFKEPTCGISALGGSTYLVADAADRYIWAIRIEKDGSLTGEPADRYCRLRVRGDDRRKKNQPPDAFRADPSAMTIDGATRLYVATNLGIQIFDPTGRLCGVITSPPGRVTELVFDGNQLFARADGKAYVRKMLAEGRK
jgi:hypothetical protein